MPEAVVPMSDAIDRLLESLRARLVDAINNGQAVRVHARETHRRGSVAVDMLQSPQQFGELLKLEKDGGFDFHLQIDPRK